MNTASSILIPRFLNTFQGFSVKDIKEYIADQRVEIYLEKNADTKNICSKCCESLGHYHDRYQRKVKHLKLFNFAVTDETTHNDGFTVIVDLKTHKVIWISQSRRKEALDTFFEIIGSVACDQHAGYGLSVEQYCKNESLVWDRFHLVQRFNDLVNDERKSEADRVSGRVHYGSLLTGKNKWIFLKKSTSRSKSEVAHINEVMMLNDKIAKLEIIK